ncbi:MAG: hypothetical protein GY821_12730 [Gammaproteobacteria bacterium]|nr:hypothetical protein [Gammaproteobacteria bacterium]
MEEPKISIVEDICLHEATQLQIKTLVESTNFQIKQISDALQKQLKFIVDSYVKTADAEGEGVYEISKDFTKLVKKGNGK